MESRIQEYFSYTLLCSKCKKTYRIIKVDLSIFDDEGNCSLTELQRMEDCWRFYCLDCEDFNCIDFNTFNKTTIFLLKKKVSLSRRLVTITKEMDKVETEIAEIKFLIEKNRLETDLLVSFSKINL